MYDYIETLVEGVRSLRSRDKQADIIPIKSIRKFFLDKNYLKSNENSLLIYPLLICDLKELGRQGHMAKFTGERETNTERHLIYERCFSDPFRANWPATFIGKKQHSETNEMLYLLLRYLGKETILEPRAQVLTYFYLEIITEHFRLTVDSVDTDHVVHVRKLVPGEFQSSVEISRRNFKQ